MSTIRIRGHDFIELVGILIGGLGEFHVPGQKLIDLKNRMVGDASEDVSQIGFRVETVKLCRANQAVDCGGALTPAFDPAKR